MKKLLLTLLATAALSSAAHAQILSVDFNGIFYNQTQSGFSGVAVPAQNSYQTTVGSYSLDVTYANSAVANPWQEGAIPADQLYSPLYKDYLSVNGFDGYTVTIGGLAANTSYDITLWLFGNTQYNFNGGSFSTFSSYALPTATNLTENAVATSFTTDSNGSFTIGIAGTGWGVGAVNGFQVSAVPEPASVTLVLGTALFGITFRRRSSFRRRL